MMAAMEGHMAEDRPVLIVERNGRSTVVTGWRAMLLAAGAMLSGLAALVFLAFLFLGIALTVGAVLLIAVPVAIVLAAVSALAGRGRAP
jgi:hypothetical protein